MRNSPGRRTLTATALGAALLTTGSAGAPLLVPRDAAQTPTPVFLNIIAFDSDRDGDEEVYVMDADGTDPRQLTRSQYANAWPQWSPDDSRIVFSSTRDGDWEIYTMAADGSDARRLTYSPGRDAHPAWLGPGRIVFQSPRHSADASEVDLFTMNTDGLRQRRLLAAPGFDGVAVPSPDHRWIAFQRGVPDLRRPSEQAYRWELFLVDSSGMNERRLTQGPWSSQVPSWNPDGTRLAFHSDSTGRDQLYLLELATGRTTSLTTSTGSDHAPSFSPDGRYVAFTSDRDGSMDLYVLRIADGTVRRLTHDLITRSQPSWSRNGRRILFSGAGTGVDEVYVINLDGTGLARLTTGTEGIRP